MKKLAISFSGGRTSAFMTACLSLVYRGERDIVVTFANTGQEAEETLEFVDRCDKYYGLNVVWLEAAVNPEKGKGTTHRVVSFETASRDGAPFEDVVSKYGLPNKNFPMCTRELKLNPLNSYLRNELGWKRGDYEYAIGIRADEAHRIPAKRARDRDGLIYPLWEWGVTKSDVLEFWSRTPFDLQIPEHYGNCVWCWKKSLRKHLTIAKEKPEYFDFPRMLEQKYANAGAGEGPRQMFRDRKTTDDIFELAKHDFSAFSDPVWEKKLDQAGGCSESCEVFGDPFA